MAYEKGKPEPGIKAKLLDDRVRGNNDFIQPAINNEHNFVDADANNQSGDHTQGSARCFSQATAPATRIDGSSFLPTDLGSLWIDTDDNAIYTLTAITPTWTPISTELYESFLASPRVFLDTLGVDGNFEVGTGGEFTVAAASGNIATAGTLDIQSTVPIAGVIDDDTMGTATDTNLATSESIKAFVEDLLPIGIGGDSQSIGETHVGDLQLKWGFKTINSNSSVTITFTTEGLTAFDNSCFNVTATYNGTKDDIESPCAVTSFASASFSITNGDNQSRAIYWFAIGR